MLRRGCLRNKAEADGVRDGSGFAGFLYPFSFSFFTERVRDGGQKSGESMSSFPLFIFFFFPLEDKRER